MQVIYSPLPDNATPDELKAFQRVYLKIFVKSVLVFLCALFLMAVFFMFSSCTPQRVVSDTREEHHTQQMLQRMDSLLSIRSVTRQDSSWRQEIMRQFQSIREKSDTSRYVVADSLGNIIRERIVINNVRETVSERERLEREVLMHRLEMMDSTVQAQNLQLSRVDSLLSQDRRVVEKEVPAQFNWFQLLQLWFGRLVLVALALCAAVVIVKRRLRGRSRYFREGL